MEKEINVLVVEPGKAPRPAKVEASMEAFAEVIGGTVETGCYLPQRVMLIRREAGPGTFLLCGFEGDVTASSPLPMRRLLNFSGTLRGKGVMPDG